jgi:hypothetical protein
MIPPLARRVWRLMQGLAIDPGAVRTGEERHCIGDVLGQAGYEQGIGQCAADLPGNSCDCIHGG